MILEDPEIQQKQNMQSALCMHAVLLPQAFVVENWVPDDIDLDSALNPPHLKSQYAIIDHRN